MRDFLKENWFVALVAAFFIAVSVFFIYDQNKGKLPGKSVSGKDVVVAIGDEYLTADDYYDDLKKSYYNGELYMSFHKALLDEAAKLSTDEQKEVDDLYNNYVDYYTNMGYGIEYLDQIIQSNYGYDTFYDYLLYSRKAEVVYNEYIKANVDDIYTKELADKLKGRVIRYVVIAIDDIDNPTEEENTKLQEAREAWASDKYNADNFADFAKAYSQDSGAANGGLIEYISTTNDTYATAFTEKAVSLNEGEVSDWFVIDEFGYFLIKVDSTNVKDFVDQPDFTSDILLNVEGLDTEIMWKKAQQIGVSFGNEEVEKLIKEYLNVKD